MADMDAVPTSQPPGMLRRLGWMAFVLLACGHFTLLDLWRSPQFLDLPLYAQYGERMPYQGRVLMAWVLHGTAGNSRVGAVLAKIGAHLPTGLGDPYIVALLISTFVAVFTAVLAARATLLALTGDRRFASWVALLTLYMAYFNLLSVYGLTYTLPYDVPSLALFSIAVWLVMTRRYLPLLAVFVVGSLNRETFCFVTVFLALYTWFDTRQQVTEEAPRVAWLRRVAPHVLLQALIWVAIRLMVHHVFRNNPVDPGNSNSVFDFHLVQNVKSLLKPPQWPLYLSLFGFTLPLFFCGYRWVSDRALARSLAVLLAVWAVAMMIVGVIVEIRVFDELTAFLVPAIGLILWNRWVLPASKASVIDAV